METALRPASPGRFVRVLGRVVPGVRLTGEQIVSYADQWRTEAERALDGDGPVFVALGDSLAQGIGADRIEEGYVSLVAGELPGVATGVSVLNLSRSGARLRDVIDEQLPALASITNPIVGGVCTVGSNDLVRSGRLGQTRRHFTELLDVLPPQVIMGTIPDAKSMTAKAMNRHVRSEADRLGRPIADVAAALTSWKGLMARDGFHPNSAGHRLWADTFLAQLSTVSDTAHSKDATNDKDEASSPAIPLGRRS